MEKGNRRQFLKTLGLAGAGAFAGYAALGQQGHDKNTKKITLLHTNDTHSRLDPYPFNDPNYPNMGGYARRAALINHFRQNDPQLLLLDAGDIFQGTPYYNMYGGEPELRLMSKMKYDAATIGNHEFDNGLEGLDKVLPFAEFPFVSSNYDFSGTILAGKIKDHLLLERNTIKIGIYGLGIKLQGLVGRDLYADTIYNDPIEVARSIEQTLRKEHGCQLIICLSHLGFRYEEDRPSDMMLATNTMYTDIIIGGHTHTLLDPPTVVENQRGKNVAIGQSGYGGVRIGKMDIYFDRENEVNLVESYAQKIC